MPFLSILTKYIVKTEEKVNKSNLKTFCKVCIEVLGKEEGLVDTISSQQSSKPPSLRLRTKLYISYGWALSWINNPKAKELFEFLNPFLKLPDCCVLSGDILDKVVVKLDDAMDIALKEDPVGVILTFDSWTNVNNEQLLETVLLTLEGKPYV
ncbi:uncharacterized protein OCT59_014569 [Rhizophagus irregularis]|uniref:uncharacterized protein n=1 Tax=Rhizophagus irregularis TaxID=588596 RepID=UPI000CA98D53|nr:hypothetical protein OCT59_014569 [Rhizophagus irregularis]